MPARMRYSFWTSETMASSARRVVSGRDSLGINPQHIFGAGGAHHDPAEVADEELDAVDIFAASDGPVENRFHVGVGEIAQRFFFLAVFGGRSTRP